MRIKLINKIYFMTKRYLLTIFYQKKKNFYVITNFFDEYI